MIPPPDDQERRELAEINELAGRALSWAQFFEAELVNVALCHGVARKKFRLRAEAEAFLQQQDRRRVRKLLKEILARVKFEPDLTATFEDAIDRRNHFVHRYFWDRIEDLGTADGRAAVKIELRDLMDTFYSAQAFAVVLSNLYIQQIELPDSVRAQFIRPSPMDTTRHPG